jgi:hypothetical protein
VEEVACSVEEVTEETAERVKKVLETLSATIQCPVHLALDQTWQKRWLGEEEDKVSEMS